MPEPPRPHDVDELMKALGAAPPKGPSPAGTPIPPPSAAVPPPAAPMADIDMLNDVNVQVRVELGRARLYVQDVLKLAPGSVVPLENMTSDPLDIYVNDRLVARGEILVVGNDNFAVRITEVVGSQKAHAK